MLNKQYGRKIKLRICIIGNMNLKHMSLLSHYTDFFDKNNIDYDFIYIDKYNIDEATNANKVYKYQVKYTKETSRLKKIISIFPFRDFVKDILKQNNYDYIIVWRTETGIALFDILEKYKNKYFLNIRDYCYEQNKLFFIIVSRLVKNSKITTISSKGFYKFLPTYNYQMIHSLNEQLLNKMESKTRLKEVTERINICSIGYIRFIDQDKKLLDQLGNDSRYLLQFFGEGSDILKKYANEKNIKNVEFTSGFDIEDTVDLLRNADVINNLYGYGNLALDTAISTRYYYSLYMNIPIIVYKDTYMERISSQVQAFSVSKKYTNLADSFYKWYHSLEFTELKQYCDTQITDITNENKKFKVVLEKTFLEDI